MNEETKALNPELYINTAMLYELVCEDVPEMITAIGGLYHLLTPSYIFSDASVLYGTMMAYSLFKEANNESIGMEERKDAAGVFMELLNYGFNIRILNSQHYLLKNLRRRYLIVEKNGTARKDF